MITMRYVVCVLSYIKNDIDGVGVCEFLQSLKNEGIDVIFCTHSNKYLDRASELCKYVYYNSDNMLIKFSDFIENVADLDDNTYTSWGHSWRWHPFEFGEYSENSCNSPHSAACLKLYKMGLSIAKENNYEYMITIEADVRLPACGLKKMIEDKIVLMEGCGKRAYYIVNDISLIPNPMHIVGVSDLYGVSELYESGWDISKSDYIKNFGYGFAESIVKRLIDKYVHNGVYVDKLETVMSEYYSDSGISNGSVMMNNIDRGLIVHIVPYISNGEYRPMFFCFNLSGETISLRHIRIYCNEELMYSNNIELSNMGWFSHNISDKRFKDTDNICLRYVYLNNGTERAVKESYKYGDSDKIYDKVMRFKLKNVRKKYIIWTFDYVEHIGGIVVLHLLGKKLRDRGCEVYMYCNRTTDGLSTIDGDGVNKIKDESWIIYPEIVHGNPLGGKNIIRWVLCDVEYHGGNSDTWGGGDVVYKFSEFFKVRDGIKVSDELLRIFDSRVDFFKNENVNGERNISCHLYRKCRGVDSLNVHREDSVCVDNLCDDFNKLKEVLNSTDIFISYDTRTYYSIIAALCGATSIIVPDPKYSREEYMVKNPLFKYGIAYGLDDIEWAIQTRHRVRDYMIECEKVFDISVDEFIKKTIISV